MNRPQQIREVFFELRRVVGKEASARELFQLAASIVRMYAQEEEEEDEVPFWGNGPFFSAEIDRAMADGGWRVVNFEAKSGMSLTDERPDNQTSIDARLRSLIGSITWPPVGTGLEQK